ncbi:MAG: protein-disulfide reductase DsbD family protein [Lacipirellulaceae bacterium]
MAFDRTTSVLFLAHLAIAALLAAPRSADAQIDFTGGLGDGAFVPGASADGGLFGESVVAEPVRIKAQFVDATPNRPAVLMLTATIAPGYHVYSTTQPRGGPGATRIEVADTPDYRVIGAFDASPAPDAHIDTEVWKGLSIEEHAGVVTWFAPIRFAEGVSPTTATVKGRVRLQACQSNSCEPITLTFEAMLGPGVPLGDALAGLEGMNGEPAAAAIDTPPTQASSSSTSDVSLVGVLGAALVGGLILNLMPCVLPVIGLKVFAFAKQAGHDRGKVLAMNLAYVAGLMSVFLLLAALAAYAGYGWGELYTKSEFKIGIIALVFAMAMSFLGVWEIPIPGFAGGHAANDLQQQEGYAGAFFKGIFTTILATPCSGPLLGTAIGFTLGKPAWTTFLVFGAIGLGMASPYLLIGAFPGLVRWLPKPGAWMETFKQLMGFVLLATVIYLFYTLKSTLFVPTLTMLLAIGFGCWWIGSTPLTASATKRTAAWLGGVGTAIAVAWGAFWLNTPSTHELPWKPYSAAALAAERQSGRTVLVDFTANWCLTCKLNLKTAIDTKRVKEVIEANRVTALLGDWSDENPEVEQALESLGSRSIPLLAIYPAGKADEPIVLRDLITESQLLDALRRAGAGAANGGEIDLPEIEIGGATSPLR